MQNAHIIMHIRSCGEKKKITQYTSYNRAKHIQYIYEQVFLLQLSPSCKTNTALLDELSYRLKRQMNIHRSHRDKGRRKIWRREEECLAAASCY